MNINPTQQFKDYAWFSVQVDQFYATVRIYARNHDALKRVYEAIPSREEWPKDEAKAAIPESVKKLFIASASTFNHTGTTGIFTDSPYEELKSIPQDMINKEMAIPIELEKLQEYYEINLTHARWSFWASLGSVIVGLAALLFGVFMLYAKESLQAGVIATSAGVISEFLSATFFYLYNKNLKQLNFFYEKLIKLQDTYWAMGLLNGLPEGKKAEMIEIIITNLITRNEPKTNMSPDQIRAYAEAMQAKRMTEWTHR